ncbi:MAG: DUF2007 domain-containing protein [Thiolinea sp.]
MKTIYRAANITEAHLVAGMLEAQGIAAHVGGHYLQGGVGEIATMDFARVWVADEDYEAARPLIAEYEDRSPEDQPNDPEQITRSASGLFSRSALFWISLILLLYWLLF